MNEIFQKLADIVGQTNQFSTITIEMNVDKETLNRAMVAASRLTKEDQEVEFFAYIVSRTGYYNMTLLDFELEP